MADRNREPAVWLSAKPGAFQAIQATSWPIASATGAALLVSPSLPLSKLPSNTQRMRVSVEVVSSTPVCQLCGHPIAATYDSEQSEGGLTVSCCAVY